MLFYSLLFVAACASNTNADVATATTNSSKTSAIYKLSWLVKLKQADWQIQQFQTGVSTHRMTWQLSFLWNENGSGQSVVQLKLVDASLVKIPFNFQLYLKLVDRSRYNIGDWTMSGSIDGDLTPVRQVWFSKYQADKQLAAIDELLVDVQLNADLLYVEEERFDFGEYLNSTLFSDVQIVAGHKTFNAHKLVLAAQSPVFSQILAALGEGDAENSTTYTHTAEADDGVTGDIFGHFLRYLYVKELEHNVLSQPRVALALFDLSYKYDVKSLRQRTAVWLSQHLEVNTVLAVLHLAGERGHIGLRDASIVYLIRHSAEVTKRADWEPFVQQHGAIVGAMMAKMNEAAKKYQPNYYNAIEQAPMLKVNEAREQNI